MTTATSTELPEVMDVVNADDCEVTMPKKFVGRSVNWFVGDEIIEVEFEFAFEFACDGWMVITAGCSDGRLVTTAGWPVITPKLFVCVRKLVISWAEQILITSRQLR